MAWLETAMIPEFSGSELSSPHVERDPGVKWPEINQVYATTLGAMGADPRPSSSTPVRASVVVNRTEPNLNEHEVGSLSTEWL